jgi:hypothetical protein
MIKINYFDERELLVKREIETKTLKDTEAKVTEAPPTLYVLLLMDHKHTRLYP